MVQATEGHGHSDSSSGLLALLPGDEAPSTLSMCCLCEACPGQGPTAHGLEALDFGAHFPCLQAPATAQALLGSPGLGAVGRGPRLQQ